MFSGCCLYGNRRNRQTQAICNRLTHGLNVGGQLRLLSCDGDVAVHDRSMLLEQAFLYGREKFQRRNPMISFVRIREQVPDIAECYGSEHRIHQRMEGDIGIRMPQKTHCMRNFNPAKNQFASGHQLMDIIPIADMKLRLRRHGQI